MRRKILIFILILVLIFIYFKDFGNYKLAGRGKSFTINKNNKIDSLLVEYKYLTIYLDPKLNRDYILEKIEIIYHNEKLGEILVNKNLSDLHCFEKQYSCTYEMSEKELKKILDRNKMYKKIRTRFYEYGINYFEFKIFIKNVNCNIKCDIFLKYLIINFV